MAYSSVGHHLICVVCLKEFASHRNTRWCSPDCRRQERAMRIGDTRPSPMIVTKSVTLAKARLEMALLEFNEAHPEHALKLVAA